jgi:hypothetical protein
MRARPLRKLTTDNCSSEYMSDVAKVASWPRGARAVTVITVAGIAAESGVLTSRGTDGLWRSFRPEEVATPQAFERTMTFPLVPSVAPSCDPMSSSTDHPRVYFRRSRPPCERARAAR